MRKLNDAQILEREMYKFLKIAEDSSESGEDSAPDKSEKLWKDILDLIEESRVESDFKRLIQDFGNLIPDLIDEKKDYEAEKSKADKDQKDAKAAAILVQKIAKVKPTNEKNILKLIKVCEDFETSPKNKKIAMIKSAKLNVKAGLDITDRTLRSIPYVGTLYSICVIIMKLKKIWDAVGEYLEDMTPNLKLNFVDYLSVSKLQSIFNQRKDDAVCIKELAQVCIYMNDLIEDLSTLIGHGVEVLKDVILYVPEVISVGTLSIEGEALSAIIANIIKTLETIADYAASSGYEKLLNEIEDLAEDKVKK